MFEQNKVIQGPAGNIELKIEEPSEQHELRGSAIICHPHPLFGGTMDNKVVNTLARAFVHSGWRAIRFNFRGVGASQGQYDQGIAEASDVIHLVEQLAPEGKLALAGFSFGAYVASHALRLINSRREIEKVVLVGTAAENFDVAQIPEHLREKCLVIHGENDRTVALQAVFNWARPQNLPVTVMPGCEHFFHGQLVPLKNLVIRHLQT